MARTRLKAGDIIEIPLHNRSAYALYVGEHPEYGGTLWLNPAVHDMPPADPDVALGDDGYYAFYPVRTAVAKGLVRIVGEGARSQRSMPDALRRAGARGPKGQVFTWIISDGTGDVVVDELTAADRGLPIAAIWNHEMLLQRIAEGWRPEDVG